MIVTVTLNTGIDQTLIVPEFELNKTIRASQSAMGMGGKASDASWMLGKMGISNLATGFAAGTNGRRMVEMLEERGSETDFVWVDGETRLNTILVCQDGGGQSTFTTSTLKVSPRHILEFREKYLKSLSRAACLIIGGSLPSGVPVSLYKELIEDAHNKRIPVIFDASGPGLLAGLEGRPDFIKPNRVELEEISGTPVYSMEDVYHASRLIQERYGSNVIVTLGSQGALALLPNQCYRIPQLSVSVVSAAGAGDGVLAGLAASIENNQPIEEGLRLAFALASANLLTLATADFNPSDLDRLFPLIELILYRPE